MKIFCLGFFLKKKIPKSTNLGQKKKKKMLFVFLNKETGNISVAHQVSFSFFLNKKNSEKGAPKGPLFPGSPKQKKNGGEGMEKKMGKKKTGKTDQF